MLERMISLIIGTHQPGSNASELARQMERICADHKAFISFAEFVERLKGVRPRQLHRTHQHEQPIPT